jgi:hypothetical protein
MRYDNAQGETVEDESRGGSAWWKANGRPRLHVALVDVGQEHRRALQKACVAGGCSPVFKSLRGASADQLGLWADLVVVECDCGFRALHTAERARRAGTSLVGVLVNWWSDLEWDAQEVADFVLHVPLAPDEVRDVLTSSILAERGTASPEP